MYYTVDMVTDSEEQTIEFAAQYARTLKKGDVVLLGGEMGPAFASEAHCL